MEKIKGKFELKYENGPAASYLILRADAAERIESFQVEMIANNPSPGILRLDIRHKDDTLNLYYNITSKQSLSGFLKGNKLKVNECISLLNGVVSIILGSSKYLLSDKRFLIDTEYVFITPSGLEVSLMYIPAEVEADMQKDLENFVAKLISHTSKNGISGEYSSLQRIIDHVRADTFSLADLKKLLIELQFGKTTAEKPKVDDNKSSIYNGKTPVSSDAEIKQSPADKDTGAYRYGPILAAVASQIFILAMIALSWDLLRKLEDDMITTCTGVVVAVLGLDYFLFKYLFGKRNVVKGQERKPLRKRISAEIPGKAQAGTEKSEAKDRLKAFNRQCLNTGVENPHKSQEKLPARRPPYLQGKKNGRLETVPVTKESFLIGRMKEKVDFTSFNKAVGKIHAQIITRNNRYYLKDLNSKNGTFINDVRLDSNTECEIKNSDRLTFANSCYTFIIPH